MNKNLLPTVATLAVIIALGHMPYSFYTLLRIVLCLVFVLAFVRLRSDTPVHHRVILVFLAVIYNPLMPVHLRSKDFWTLINIASVIYLWVVCLRFGAWEPSGKAKLRT